jgi:class 3 adenylate cyclase
MAPRASGSWQVERGTIALVRLLRFLFRQLGRVYLAGALLVTMFSTHVIVFASIALLALWVNLSGGEFGRIVAVSQGAVLVENLMTLAYAWRQLQPARRWIAERDGGHADAWRALLTLPRLQLRRTEVVASFVSVIPVCAYITYEVQASWLGFLALLAAAYVVLMYGAVWRILILELLLRPGVEAASTGLTERVAGKEGGVPLRFKLFACIPLANVGTGLAVAGLSSDSRSGLSKLGLDVAIAVGVAFTLSLGLTALLASSILGPLRELIRATRRVAEDKLDQPVPVTSTDETGELTESFNDMVKAVAERERLREAFGTFVDPGLAQRVLEEGTAIEGEEVEVTVLFLDVCGFTSFSEETEPREVVAALNELFEIAVPIVLGHGGHIDKFIGDGFVAVFGAPERRPDHARRAVAAAREILDKLAEHDSPLRVGIGVNTGKVIAGTVGGGGRLDFTVIGDTVNTAARVERLTRQTGDDLLITEATRRQLDEDDSDWEERPSVELEGKRAPVKVYAPVARARVG